jgi:hypothetical protein
MLTRRLVLPSLAATLLAAGALTTVAGADDPPAVTCDDLQTTLDNPEVVTVTLKQGEDCARHYTLPSRAITLQGGGAGATLRSDMGGKANHQILSGDDVGATTIRNLTFRGGRNDEGAAIQVGGHSPIHLENNRFFDNVAGDGDGGAVLIDTQQPSPRTERRAAADSGDQVLLVGNEFGREASTGPPAVTAESGNRASHDGGAAAIFSDVPVTLTDNVVFDSRAGSDGDGRGAGILLDLCRTTAGITGNVFRHNELAAGGGPRAGAGLAVERALCESFRSSAASLPEDGTAFDVEQQGNHFESNVIHGGSGSAEGAGESVERERVRSVADRFVSNAIEEAPTDTGPALLKISEPEAEGAGLSVSGAPGQLAFEGRDLVAAANTIARGEGAGIYVGVTDTRGTILRLFDSTVVSNTVGAGDEDGGSGIDGGPRDSLLAYNTIVHGNTGPGEEIGGFDQPTTNGRAAVENPPPGTRDIRASIVCLKSGQPHPAGDAATPNRCVDPKLADPAKGDINQTTASPSIDTGSDALVPDLLKLDYAGDPRRVGASVDVGADEFVPVAEQQQQQQKATATPVAKAPAAKPKPAAPKPAPVEACASRRAFRIRLRVPRGHHARSAKVEVNGKQVRILRGKRLRSSVVLRGLPRGTVVVRITIRLRGGGKVSGARTYHTCTAKRPTKRPPKV